MAILGVVISGALIGLLGKLLTSSKHLPFWLTIVYGVGGAVGGWLLLGLSDDAMGGTGWSRWTGATGVAATVVINACLAFRGDENAKRRTQPPTRRDLLATESDFESR